jgi:hypothetical protein
MHIGRGCFYSPKSSVQQNSKTNYLELAGVVLKLPKFVLANCKQACNKICVDDIS